MSLTKEEVVVREIETAVDLIRPHVTVFERDCFDSLSHDHRDHQIKSATRQEQGFTGWRAHEREELL